MLAGALLMLVLAACGEVWAARTAREQADADAGRLARDNAALFSSELQKFRLLPVALSEFPSVAALLARPDDPARVNAELEHLAARTNAAAIYVIGREGVTLAASNYRQPTSFVGQNYSFRPYFIDALRDGAAELFALGTVSGRPGLFIASRIGSAARPLGVIVVKIEFDSIERAWSKQPGLTFVAERHGVVIVTSRPRWRFRTLDTLADAARREIAAARQFPGRDLAPLNLGRGSDVALDGAVYRRVRLPLPLAGAGLHVLIPLAPALSAAHGQAWSMLAAAAGLLAFALLWLFRQAERDALAETTRRELESQVAERTSAMQVANAALLRQSAERARADERYREAREELAQASRLATLGQIAAGIAHELNQPAAAIRAFAENARAFIEMGQSDRARENLGHIVGLTQRVSAISGELRQFARKRTRGAGVVDMNDAIDGALMIVSHQLRRGAVSIEWRRDPLPLAVRGERVRLEQIIVNLVQNALQALAGHADGRIVIAPTASAHQVEILVTDNGPGVPQALVETLFTPFATGREDGLGLGLAIARDIARGFGGDLQLAANGPDGASFALWLERP
ncbi:MAG: sensor histidine kinase [Alphaproteobacteria bacterium]|nr:sensor histidine kinase [Alphaproteobacteria bacterium]